MTILRKTLGKVIRAFLPASWIRIIRHPAILPSYYRKFADEIEPLLDSIQNNHRNAPEYLMAMLRKYVHILDKGLQRLDFEPGHSNQWYEEAKMVLEKIEALNYSDPTIIWAKEKINEYERRQIKPQNLKRIDSVSSISQEDYNIMQQIIYNRRSIRQFTQQPVEADKLNTIIQTINWSPTSCNRQPAKVFIATAPELVRQCANTCAGATCFSGNCAFISFCADIRLYNMPEEYLLPNLDIGLGIQNCLLIGHALGLSMTLLSWAQHTNNDDKDLRNILSIPSYYRIVVNALIGYPTQYGETPSRKTLASTISYVSSFGERRD